MIRKYRFGEPIETQAVVCELPIQAWDGSERGEAELGEGFAFTLRMEPEEAVYGLGEALRGINKRNFRYVSNNTDEPFHLEGKESLYGAHNFIVLSGGTHTGYFFDYPGRLTFDIGYTRQDTLRVSCERAELYLYVIEGSSARDVVRQLRGIIGRSYIPPRFAFGYGQSRWGYRTMEDFREVLREHRQKHVPLDMLYMDIDYMERFKDFTVNAEQFPDLAGFVAEMKAGGVRLVPIIDAGVKVEKGYEVYEEGVENGYFCTDESGEPFMAAVWPGWVHFPDFLNERVRRWFGDKYRFLLDRGIEGFWNDMNEPAIFYSRNGLEAMTAKLRDWMDGRLELPPESTGYTMTSLPNSPEDYRSFWHDMDGKRVRHDTVHNLYGYFMTRAASEAFERAVPDKRILMFSRSSYIGAHRYGGIWMGDNRSWWSHILLSLRLLPSLNMCGYLYTGPDLGGFGDDTTREQLLRWLALGVFTPLMRNHSAAGTRLQEFFRFEGEEDFRHVIGVRYRLIPYLYSEYMKAALNDDMLFRPLAFDYPEDRIARQIEDQLMLGGEAMIAPVYEQNATGRFVYLPEDMLLVRFPVGGELETEALEKGVHWVDIALSDVVLFIRSGCCIPIADAAETVEAIDPATIRMVGREGASYERYDDDGVTPIR